MYLFDDELADTFRRGHSVVVYQHFPREKRHVYLAGAFAKIRAQRDPPDLFALWSGRIAFFVVPQEQVAASLREAARDVAYRWAPLLAFTRECDVSVDLEKLGNE